MPKHYIHRLNWWGLGVTQTEQGERCVPITKVGEKVSVVWHQNEWGRVIGQRLEVDDSLQRQLQCDQAVRCPACTLRHMSLKEQHEIQKDNHIGALQRLWQRGTLDIKPKIVTASGPNNYRHHLRSTLISKRKL